MENKQSTNLAENVMTEIKERDVKMRPRIYFVVGSVLLGVGLTLALVTASFLVNLISFRLRMDRPYDYLHFGQHGIQPFLAMFPWLLILTIVGLVVVGIYFLKRYEFSYKHNFAAITIIIVTAIIVSSVIIDRIGVNRFLEGARPFQRLYLAHHPGQNWVLGDVIEVREHQIMIDPWVRRNGDGVVVIWNTDTKLPFGHDFKVGESIRAFGEWQDSVLHAHGISKGKLHRPIVTPRIRGFRLK